MTWWDCGGLTAGFRLLESRNVVTSRPRPVRAGQPHLHITCSFDVGFNPIRKNRTNQILGRLHGNH